MTTVPSGIWPIDPNVTTGTDLATYLSTWMDAFQSMQASPTRPPLIAKGGVWAKTLGTSDIALMFYDGTSDHEIGSVKGGSVAFGGGVVASATAPTAPSNGDTWVDTSAAGAPVLKLWNGTAWALISPDPDKLLFGGATKAEATTAGVTVTGALNVANITDGTDTVETGYVINGSAKAWGMCNASGNPIDVGTFNVSSITDDGVDGKVFHLTSSFSTVPLPALGLSGISWWSNTAGFITAGTAGVKSNYVSVRYNSGPGYSDKAGSFSALGDLA